MFGSHRRFVRRWEWETFIPKLGDFPQTSHTAATTTTHLALGFGLGSGCETAPNSVNKPGDQRVRLPSSAMRSHAGPGARGRRSMSRRTTPAGRADAARAVPAAAHALGASELVATMLVYRDALKAHQATLNRLNVYPVPDGDTGTNMLLTMDAVCRELAERPTGNGARGAGGDMAGVCAAIAHGSLMGARGNSGVILCQVLRGIATTCEPLSSAGGGELAAAFDAGSRAARGGRPAPGRGDHPHRGRRRGRAARAAVDAAAALVGGARRGARPPSRRRSRRRPCSPSSPRRASSTPAAPGSSFSTTPC